MSLPRVLITASGPAPGFGIVQPITGTSPTADQVNDTLTLASADGSVSIVGDSSTDTIDFSVSAIGRSSLPFVTKTTNYTLTTSDVVVLSNVTSAATTYTLPAASTWSGRFFIIKDIAGKAGTYNLTIDGNSSELIDGELTYKVTINYQSVTLYSNGTAVFII